MVTTFRTKVQKFYCCVIINEVNQVIDDTITYLLTLDQITVENFDDITTKGIGLIDINPIFLKKI